MGGGQIGLSMNGVRKRGGGAKRPIYEWGSEKGGGQIGLSMNGVLKWGGANRPIYGWGSEMGGK